MILVAGGLEARMRHCEGKPPTRAQHSLDQSRGGIEISHVVQRQRCRHTIHGNVRHGVQGGSVIDAVDNSSQWGMLGRFGIRDQRACGIYAHDACSGGCRRSADDGLTATNVKNIETKNFA
ncbi:Uncharacterised protein [Mycolicibacterium vanbaalenii]|uniref:Uncharacterized protein n=1 Tax=Mycolicibacterium vanbaalenii TaxID=110539 RepID=A0A5S9QYJ0_MYCVN|nr:hypothetical protein [Mycolicibacterium vanbaalenii]CAA0124272.1 Uncharacterised protein [Mycolicibacterium vanbaalenii]